MNEEPREDLEYPAFVWRDDGGGSMGGLEAVMLLIMLIVMAAS